MQQAPAPPGASRWARAKPPTDLRIIRATRRQCAVMLRGGATSLTPTNDSQLVHHHETAALALAHPLEQPHRRTNSLGPNPGKPWRTRLRTASPRCAESKYNPSKGARKPSGDPRSGTFSHEQNNSESKNLFPMCSTAKEPGCWSGATNSIPTNDSQAPPQA